MKNSKGLGLTKKTAADFNPEQMFYFFSSMLSIWEKLTTIPDALLSTFYFQGFLLFKDRLISRMSNEQEMNIYLRYRNIFHKFIEPELSEFNEGEIMYLWKYVNRYEVEKLQTFETKPFKEGAQMLIFNNLHEEAKKMLSLCKKWDKIFNENKSITDCEKVLRVFFSEILSEPGFFQHRLAERLLLWKFNGNVNYFKALMKIDPKEIDFSKEEITYEKWVDEFSGKLLLRAEERNTAIVPKIKALLLDFHHKRNEAWMSLT